jgi:hypothetical protein
MAASGDLDDLGDPALAPTDDETDMMDDGDDDGMDMMDDDEAREERAHLDARDRLFCRICKQHYVLDPNNPGERHDCAALAAAAQDFLLMYECQVCKEVFTPLSNVGMHQCRCHPGTYDPDTGWSCCGKRRVEITGRYVHNMVWQRRGQIEPLPPRFVDRRGYQLSNGRTVKLPPDGCTPCDHRHTKLPPALSARRAPLDTARMPVQVLAQLRPPAPDRPGWDTTRPGMLRGRGRSPAEIARAR